MPEQSQSSCLELRCIAAILEDAEEMLSFCSNVPGGNVNGEGADTAEKKNGTNGGENNTNTNMKSKGSITTPTSPVGPPPVATEREVVTLRKAFQSCVDALPIDTAGRYGEGEGEAPAVWNATITKCDRLLSQLEATVARSPDAWCSEPESPTVSARLNRKSSSSGGPSTIISSKKKKLNKALRDSWWRSLFASPAKRVRKAPHHISQLLVVSTCLFFTGLPLSLFLVVLFLLIPWTMPFMVAHLIYCFTLKHKFPIHGWAWFRNGFVFRHYRDYFPIRTICHREDREKFDPKRNYLFCSHPHGIHCFGAMITFSGNTTMRPKLLPGLKFHLQTLKVNGQVPFWRYIFLWSGMGDASSACIKSTLSAGPGECPVLIVGGAEEAIMSTPHTNRLLLSKRKGFVKIALQMGSPLVPTFSFGENDAYDNYGKDKPWVHKVMLKIEKTIGFGLPLIRGRSWFTYSMGPLPRRRPIVTVIGAPVEVPQISNPTQEDIEKYHKLYVEALLKVINENGPIYDVFAKSEAKIVC